MSLALENIRKEYDGKVAVNNLSLEVPSGEIYGIIGPNGAGKTTTIRMIMNITIPDSGQVLVDGRPIDSAFRDRVGYLPEERGLYKKMKVYEILVYMAELKGRTARFAMDRIDDWLQKVELSEYKDKKVEELSKGMQQKLQFVSTIMHDPDIIIFDELFSGLDPLNMELIKNILLDLKRAGKTILFSTHVMEQAEKLCDYVCMISRGEKVIDGRLAEVKTRFGRNRIQVEIDGDGSFIQSTEGVKSVTEFNNYLELQPSDGADSNALLISIAERVSIKRFEVVTPSLYDIFIDMARIDPSTLNPSEEQLD
ncbi:MAG: ABC transporter ATP-binding protein [Candidatus Zixiibacteriota bacterium]